MEPVEPVSHENGISCHYNSRCSEETWKFPLKEVEMKWKEMGVLGSQI